MKIKKIIWRVSLALILLPGLLYVGMAVYFLQTADIEDVMICTSEGSGIAVPPQVCREWIYAFRGTSDDVKSLHSSIGIGWVFATPREEWEPMAKFWLSKGVDINHCCAPLTSLTALHGAALGGNAEEVELLLKLGADPMLRDTQRGLTALEYAEQALEGVLAKGIEDVIPKYTATVELLKNAQASSNHLPE